MCIFCGTPDPSHDLLIMRAAVLTLGGGGILAPRRWKERLLGRAMAAAARLRSRRGLAYGYFRQRADPRRLLRTRPSWHA